MTDTTWLTVKEACEMLKISRPTLYRYIKANKLVTGKIIGKTLVSKESIQAALQVK